MSAVPALGNKLLRRVVALEPDGWLAYWYLALNARLKGDLEESRRVLESYPGDDREFLPYGWYEHYFCASEFDQAIRALEETPKEMDSHEALLYPNTLFTGLAHLAKGDSVAARDNLETARQTLRALIQERPDDHRLYSSLGLAQAGLGEAKAAVANGRKSVEMYPMSKDRYGGTWRLIELTQVYALAGYVDEAIEQVDELLTIDCYVTTNWFKLNPNFDRIRTDPRFDELMRKHDPST